MSNAIYGTRPLGSVGEAFLRGAGAGAATAGINYISDLIGQKPGWKGIGAGPLTGMAGGLILPYVGAMRDPRSGCGSASPFVPILGYSSAKGYQYSIPQAEDAGQKQKKFSLKEFLKETAVGGITGGFASAGFYGAGKGIERLKDSFRSGRRVVISTAKDDWCFGRLSPEESLNRRQKELLESLSKSGEYTFVRKKSVSMNDLRQLTNVTGDEFDMFTRGGRRLIIRGSGNKVDVSKQMYDDIVAGVYGRFSGHTHPGYSLGPGPSDAKFLKKLGQYRSSVWGNTGKGWLPFGQAFWLNDEIRVEINREKMQRFYGRQ